MKICTATQIREWEETTMQQQDIGSPELMERAASACCSWIKQRFNNSHSFLVVAGMGNNGGDGLALARMLLQEGYPVKIIILKHRDQFSANTSHNLKLLHQLAADQVTILEEGQFVTGLPEEIIIIDALFGIGLNRPISGWVAEFIDELNLLPNQKIALDIPSGLPADNLPAAGSPVLNVAHTLSFQLYKRSFLHPETASVTGAIHLADIGLSETYIQETHSLFHLLDLPSLQQIYRPRQPFSHKGDYGTVALLGGSYGKMGAIVLCAQGALHAGAGKLFVHAPGCGYEILQTAVPEAMFQKSGDTVLEQFAIPSDHTVGIGPGLGTHADTIAAFRTFLEQYEAPLVLDADALNILAKDKSLLARLPAGSILTPHPGECERLFGATGNSMEQTELARSNAMEYNVIIVLKGHHTAICLPDGSCWYNTTGNAGMATGGSGDVLTGIITALLAQHYSSASAALLGVYLHGTAGDLSIRSQGQEALSATDIIHHLGKAFLTLQASSEQGTAGKNPMI